MKLISIKTRKFLPPQDDIFVELKKVLKGKIKNGDVLAVASKVVCIHEGRCLSKDKASKKQLIKKYSDFYLPSSSKKYFNLSIKYHALMLSAGIDKSNAGGYYVLPLKNPNASAKKIRNFVKKEFKLKKLGVIIIDSHTTPLRYGVVGISIGSAGFEPVRIFTGKKDLFGRKFRRGKVNIADNLAAAASLVIGEAKESTPLCLIKNVPQMEFTEKPSNELFPPYRQDIYYPITKRFFGK